MEKYAQSDSTGSVKIADEVIATIASMAAAEVDGVAQAPRGALEVKDILSKKGYKGVKVDTQDGRVTIDVNLSVIFGYKIAEVAEKVQKKVLDAVTAMTGLELARVNIHVSSVVFPKEKDYGREDSAK